MAVDSRAANEWPQVVRGMCGVPALSTTSGLRSDPTKLASTVATVSQEVGSRGGRLVLLAADSAQALDRLGATSTSVADTTVREDEHVLEQRPSHTDPLPIRVWSPLPRSAVCDRPESGAAGPSRRGGRRRLALVDRPGA